VVVDGVDAVSAAAIALTVAARGAARPRTTVLLTPRRWTEIRVVPGAGRVTVDR
jgi:hypothetical protein